MTDPLKKFKDDLQYITERVNKSCGDTYINKGFGDKAKKAWDWGRTESGQGNANDKKVYADKQQSEWHEAGITGEKKNKAKKQHKSNPLAGKLTRASADKEKEREEFSEAMGTIKSISDIQHYDTIINKREYTPEEKRKHQKEMDRWWMIEDGKDPDEEEDRKLERDIGLMRQEDEDGMKDRNEFQHDTHRRTIEENRYKQKNASLEEIQHYKNTINKNKTPKPKTITLESGVKITRATPKPGQKRLEGDELKFDEKPKEEEKPKEKFKQTTL